MQLINEAPAAPPMPTMVAPPTLPNSLPNLMPPMLNPAMLAGAGMGGAASMMGANPAAMMGGMPGGMNPAMMAAAGMNPAVMAAMASGLALPGAVPGMPAAGAAPAGPSTCYVLMKNLFDPNGEEEKADPNFFDDLKEDVTEELQKHGAVQKLTVLRESAGHILVHLADELAAANVVSALNGRWFAGKQIDASTIEQEAYEQALNA